MKLEINEHLIRRIKKHNEEPVEVIENLLRQYVKEKRDEKILSESMKETVYPDNKISNSAATIELDKESVSVLFEKNSDFIEIVKNLGYRWNGKVWIKDINDKTGSSIERAIEVGNKLLSEGFPISAIKQVRERAVSGDFENECTNWVYAVIKGEYKGRLSIRWQGYSESLYGITKRIPSSKWDNGMLIKVEYYNEVEDFAQLYGFKFTESAKQLIKEYTEAKENINTVNVKENKKVEKKGLSGILESDVGVIDELKD